MAFIFAQGNSVTTDWFQLIIQGGSFALIVFMVLFGAYFLIKEWPKIRKEQRDDREAERLALSTDREVDRNARHSMVQAFQVALTDNTRAHIEAYKEQRQAFDDMLVRLESKREREIDKVIASWEKQIERTIEYIGEQIEAAICHGNQDH